MDKNARKMAGTPNSRKNQSALKSEMMLVKNNLTIPDTKFIENHTFSIGHSVPVYEVSSIHGLNRLIGYAKFINREYGEVLYRGECKLHEALRPSLLRRCTKSDKSLAKLSSLAEMIYHDKLFRDEIKIKGPLNEENRAKLEGMLQHYGIPTRFIDLVDNHWVALWMSGYSPTRIKAIKEYYRYTCRADIQHELPGDPEGSLRERYGYILLVCMPNDIKPGKVGGVSSSSSFIRVDLRQSLPSTFLRPHAQHGLVVRKRGQDGGMSSFYDMASQVIGIIRIRVDRICAWLGDGKLLTQENLFPEPCHDIGYDVLLSRDDIFNKSDFSIARYAWSSRAGF